jgi:type VI protein secretion system component VasF
MKRRNLLKLATIGTAAHMCFLTESDGGEKSLTRFDQLLQAPHPCTHVLEIIRPDGRKEVLVQEGGEVHPQLIRHLHEQVDKMTNSANGTVTTKLIRHGNVHRIEIELVTPRGSEFCI